MPTCGSDAFRIAVALGAAALLLGCGQSSEKARAERARHQEELRATAAAQAAAAGGDADLVNAASPGGPGPPISLKFGLGGRPVVGEPLQIHVTMLPESQSAIRHLYGSFTPGDGLTLQSQHSFELRDVADGVSLHQDVTVVPQQAGILSLSATLIVDFDTGSVSRTFGIPLIASGPAVPAAAPATAPTTAPVTAPATAPTATAPTGSSPGKPGPLDAAAAPIAGSSTPR
jgi:hypothetical protein